MLRQTAFTLCVAALVAACNGPVRDGMGGSGSSPAYFGFRSDEQHALSTIAALEQGKAVEWKISDSSFGSARPTLAAYQDRGGRACRGLAQSRTDGSDVTAREVTGCKSLDGTWVVSDYAADKAD
ncbi:hypothetical protein [Magnetospirillum sp. UT-4]|uniref:hypothetical protein n=1 Tax=Magnetospirillum sp. UT-4 TaxID=2681467 RepID=UPI00137DAA3A|nr:hypothetical protein [Magnetospirillum sp. UT-4]CAA7617564.1 Secreted protein [Magnetospirillum sp. UT-4]